MPIKPKNYVSTHTHSDHSRQDSIAKVKDLVAKAKKLNMKALALTDHGVISGWIQFYKHCTDAGIKPIFGIESYIIDDASAIKNIEESIDTMEAKKKNNLPLFDGILENADEDIDNLKKAKTKERKSNHIILLAKNKIGYVNLIKLSTWGYKNGFYYKPRIDLKALEEHKDGLICTSACLGGQIAYNILKNNLNKARWYVQEYKRIFGDNFYLELQLHSPPEQAIVNKKLLEFSKEFHVKTTIGQDVHYVEAADVELHELVIKLKNKEKDVSLEKTEDVMRPVDIGKEVAKTKNKRLAMLEEQILTENAKEEKNALDSDGYFYNAREYFFKSFEEIEATWQKEHSYMTQSEFYQSIQNTLDIADQVDKFSVYSNVAYLPKIANEDGVLSKDLFKKIVKEGARLKLGPKIKGNPELKAVYEKRLTEELEIIFNLGFEDYFLIVWDFINWARKNGIVVGPGRGSVGGSLVAYCANITKIDPIEHSLLFSRFINKTRSSAKYELRIEGTILEKK